MTAVHALANPTHASDALCNAALGSRAARPLSEALWDLRWAEHLPFDLGNGCSVQASTFELATPFIRAHYATIFEHDSSSPFRPDALTAQKARYYELCADFFEFRRANRTIGLLVCDPLDWSTYYVRSAAILPEHQGRQLVQRFFSAVLFDVMTAVGVERIEIDIAPTNLMMLHIAARYRFVATGTLLSDRWGAHARFTRFLSANSQQTFARQFCAGLKRVPPA
jgi:hypothetical protein